MTPGNGVINLPSCGAGELRISKLVGQRNLTKRYILSLMVA
jgi:hypothetical protein